MLAGPILKGMVNSVNSVDKASEISSDFSVSSSKFILDCNVGRKVKFVMLLFNTSISNFWSIFKVKSKDCG